MHVLGREPDVEGPTARIGSFLARDGSTGTGVSLDVDGPHAGVVVGKRGTGKSYTLGVLAEELGEAPGVAPVVLDPMAAFGGLADCPDGSVVEPRVAPDSLPPDAWPELLGLDAGSPAGSLVWRVATDVWEADGPVSIARMRDALTEARASGDDCASGNESASIAAESTAARRAADNHLALADAWDVFDTEAPTAAELATGGPTVVDCAGLPPAAMNAVGRAIASGLYDARIADDLDRLPWLLVDEAHAFFDGVAAPALRTLLTRGRAPGVSLVCATQRPSALPDVAVSQADLIVAHRLTAESDVDALRAAQPTYLGTDLGASLPTGVGEALVVDDVTEAAHTVRIRERRTIHEGGGPSASALSGRTSERGDEGNEGDGDGPG
ncbi:ATP-binding protein [Haloparvum sp. AD34]